ncbi:MAG: hypothetical protein FWG49_06240 [Leptospirales bacterium]|nr:hypothetical protein [Leptospirales bacterium]
MEILKIINNDYIAKKSYAFLPYLATFYYVEIIYLMLFLNFIYGKTLAVSISIFLTALLSLHIFSLFNKKSFSRKVQLYLMDFHFAFSVAYFFNRIFTESDFTSVDSGLTIFRLATALIEIITIFAISDNKISYG